MALGKWWSVSIILINQSSICTQKKRSNERSFSWQHVIVVCQWRNICPSEVMSSCPLTGIWVRWSWILITVTVQNGDKFFYLVLWHTCSREWSVTVCLVAQLCPILCDPMDCSVPGSSVHEIWQARILEWVVISFSRGSLRPSNPSYLVLLHYRQILYWLSYKGKYY